MIWWIAGTVVVLSVLFLAWAARRTAAGVIPLRRAQRRLDDTLQTGPMAMAPRVADLQDQVADVKQRAKAVKAARASGRRRD